MKLKTTLEEALYILRMEEGDNYNYPVALKIKEALQEVEALNIIVEDKRSLKDYVFTNCNLCINRVDNKFTHPCFSCKRYYGCHFLSINRE